MRIIVPSLNRWDCCHAVGLVHGTELLVPTSQVARYMEHNSAIPVQSWGESDTTKPVSPAIWMNPILEGHYGSGWIGIVLDDIKALIPQPWSNDSRKIRGDEAESILKELVAHGEQSGATLAGFSGRVGTHTPEFQERVYAAETAFAIKVPVETRISPMSFRFWNLSLCAELCRKGMKVLRWNKYMTWSNELKSHGKTFTNWLSAGVHDDEFTHENYPEALEKRGRYYYYVEPFTT